MNVQTLEQSLADDQQLREEASHIDRQWQEKLQRLSYQADLARRRDEAVDPANRLVALTLETDWNERLVELEAARQAYQQSRPTPQQLSSTLAQMQAVLNNLRHYWYQEEVTQQEKKELLRCVIERVNLTTQTSGQVIHVEICWQGGATNEVEVPNYLFSAPQLFHRITELAHSLTDTPIAAVLTAEGLQPVKGRAWSARCVMDFRLSNGIPSGFTASPHLRLREHGYITTAEAAARFEINQTTVQKWHKLGLLQGKQAGKPSHLWLAWTDAVEQRLGGQASFDPRMISLKALCKTREQSWEQVVRWCLEEGHHIYRLRRGTTFRFYVRPGSGSLQP